MDSMIVIKGNNIAISQWSYNIIHGHFVQGSLEDMIRNVCPIDQNF